LCGFANKLYIPETPSFLFLKTEGFEGYQVDKLALTLLQTLLLCLVQGCLLEHPELRGSLISSPADYYTKLFIEVKSLFVR